MFKPASSLQWLDCPRLDDPQVKSNFSYLCICDGIGATIALIEFRESLGLVGLGQDM